MNSVLSIDRGAAPLGVKAKELRLSLLLTQYSLAAMADVPVEEVELFENNLPVRLDSKRKLLRELWARKASVR
jgi:hypothetical protein